LVIIITHVDVHPTAKDIGKQSFVEYEELKKDCGEIMMNIFGKFGLKQPPPMFCIGQYNYTETVQKLFDLSRKVPAFDCELIQKLHKYNLAKYLYDSWIAGMDLAICVKQKLHALERKEKWKLSYIQEKRVSELVNAVNNCSLPPKEENKKQKNEQENEKQKDKLINKSQKGGWCVML